MADANTNTDRPDGAQSGSNQVLNGRKAHPNGEIPSRGEMWEIIRKQEARIDYLQQQLDDLTESMEEDQDALHQAQGQLEEAAKQLREGKLGGEAGAELLMQLNNYQASTKTDARAVKLYYTLIRESKVGVRVPTNQVVSWLGIQTSNPNQTAHRVMEHLASLTEEGHMIGQVRCFLYRGKKVIEMQGDADA